MREDRAGLKRLVRYFERGPLALERLHGPADLEALTSPEARLIYRLPEPDVHGRQELRLTPLELLDRLARIYEVLPLRCPACGGEMRIISFITLPSTVERILLHLDQSPAFDLAAPEPIPEYEFDQSAPHDWEA